MDQRWATLKIAIQSDSFRERWWHGGVCKLVPRGSDTFPETKRPCEIAARRAASNKVDWDRKVREVSISVELTSRARYHADTRKRWHSARANFRDVAGSMRFRAWRHVKDSIESISRYLCDFHAKTRRKRLMRFKVLITNVLCSI